jgi:hypothetical protein
MPLSSSAGRHADVDDCHTAKAITFADSGESRSSSDAIKILMETVRGEGLRTTNVRSAKTWNYCTIMLSQR